MTMPAIDHLGLSVSDYAKAKAFYVAALAPVGRHLGRDSRRR
jgi:catechol 2,3-dioxygenase-like lactoylglutathione lyase family enzyme